MDSIVHVFAKSDTTERLSLSLHFTFPSLGWNNGLIALTACFCYGECSRMLFSISVLSLCNPMDCSMPGFPVFHYLLEFAQMATHSSVLAWRIPRVGEPGGLPSMGSHRVGYDWSDLAACPFSWWYHPSRRRQWHPTPVLLMKIPWMEEPGRLQSMGSLRVGHDWATSLSLFTFMH